MTLSSILPNWTEQQNKTPGASIQRPSDVNPSNITNPSFLEAFGGIPNSKEVCICKVDISYHLLIDQALWQSIYLQSTKVYILSMYKSILSKYKFILSKYKSILSKYRVTFKTLGAESPEPGTFLIPRVPGTRFPEPVPSKPREQNLEHRSLRNLGLATFWIQNNASGPEPAFPEAIPETEPGTGSRNPGTAPARPEHTEIYIVHRSHSIQLLRKKIMSMCFDPISLADTLTW